jgi:hypothetical protein
MLLSRASVKFVGVTRKDSHRTLSMFLRDRNGATLTTEMNSFCANNVFLSERREVPLRTLLDARRKTLQHFELEMNIDSPKLVRDSQWGGWRRFLRDAIYRENECFESHDVSFAYPASLC